VQTYLEQSETLPPSGTYNAKGRAYPDVATVGHNLLVVINGQIVPVDGTSASAPIFGGIVTLLNEVLLRNNLSPLGFLNPLLYEIAVDTPEAFYDVTVGYNRCGTIDWEPACCDFGFYASSGWDPISGLGTPNFAVLQEQVLKYGSLKGQKS